MSAAAGPLLAARGLRKRFGAGTVVPGSLVGRKRTKAATPAMRPVEPD